MKIVFLCRRFYPHIGGVEKHVMEISKRLIQDKHEVIVITEISEKTRLTDEKDTIKIFRINAGKNNWFKKFRIWKEMLRLRKLIQGADVVHCHDVFFWYLPFRFLYPHKPVYATFHGYESFPIRKRAIWMRKISEKLSWGNICIGDFIPKWYGTMPAFVSYGATDINENKDLRFKIKDNYSAVFIGRLDDQTGAMMYAKTVEILRKKYPKFDLTFVGDGKDKDKLVKKFNVLGFQNDPEKYFVNYHYAFVSRYLSILEALAARRLVFAVYDNPIKEDYLRMAPYAKWIIIENDPRKLVEKIVYYLKHPKEEKLMIEKGHQWVKNQTWEKMVTIYLSLWRQS
ncbi:MAG TPA: glycosyltransferase family 4 protein [Candidatus Acidoferrales bacterium]|nr:glycosyltransferase family 4 protein [Candidatus Acidoferrales bacterium]